MDSFQHLLAKTCLLITGIVTGLSWMEWLSAVDLIVRIALSVVGITAGLWTIKFYRARTRELMKRD